VRFLTIGTLENDKVTDQKKRFYGVNICVVIAGPPELNKSTRIQINAEEMSKETYATKDDEKESRMGTIPKKNKSIRGRIVPAREAGDRYGGLGANT